MSSTTAVKYQPLSQIAPSDDEDEGFHDNILYDSRLVSGPSMDHRNVFELEKLGQPRVKQPISMQYLGRGRRVCLLVAALSVLLLVIMVAVLFPILNHMYNHGLVTDVHSGKTSPDWIQTFNKTWTEGSVLLVDADGDGLEDILIGMAAQAGLDSGLYNDEYMTLRQCCLSPGNQYQDGGQVVALRGFDGKKLWHSLTRSMVLYQNCLDIDVNSDGRMDCIVTGYNSTCQAIDVKTGETLWTIDPDSLPWSLHFIPGWNIYGAVTLSDLDLDGVLDLLVLHGTDQARLMQGESGKPGRLILISGKTGIAIGNGYVEVPQGEDAFMSPVKYVTQEQAVYIIFGSVGESNVGRLMALSLPDLYHLATGTTLTELDLSIYMWLQKTDQDDHRGAVLFRGRGEGVMMTPVLVDMDKDNHIDLLVSSSDGSVALLDGKTLQEIWRRNFVGLEIYKSPTPGYFNTDPVLDFMVHLKKELCDSSNISQTLVLNGADGQTLWSYQAENSAFSSVLSLETLTNRQSVFIVTLVGVNSTCGLLRSDLGIRLRADQESGSNAETVQSYLSHLSSEELQKFCADIEQKVASGYVTCENDLKSLSEKVLLLDHTIDDQPLKVLERQAYKYSYREQCTTGELHCHNVSDTLKGKADMCVVLAPTSSTGAVTDVDADGSLDYIHVTQMTGLKRSDTSNTGSVIVSKHNINSAISLEDFLLIKPASDTRPNQPRTNQQLHVQSWQFSYTKASAWTQSVHSWRSGCLFAPP